MASLGYAATGFGQGMLQNREIGREQNRYNQQMSMQQQGIDLQRQGMEADQKWRERESVRQELAKIDQILANPNALTPEQLRSWQARQAGILSRYPDLDFRDNRTIDEKEAALLPAAPPMDRGMTPATAAAVPGLFETPGMADPTFDRPAPEYVPPPPMAGPPAPADYQPITDEQVSSFMREVDPDFNAAQNAIRAPAPATASALPTAAAPPQRPQGPRDSIREYHDYLQTVISDPSASVNDKRAAYKEMIELEAKRADLRSSAADAAYKETLTSQVSPDAELRRLAILEEMAMSKYKRTEYMPEELRAILIKARAKGALDPSDMIAIARLNFDIKKLAIEEQGKAADRKWERGKDVAEFGQREDLAKMGQEGQAAQQVRGTILKGLLQSVTRIDPVTRQPIMKPGGLQQLEREANRLLGQGEMIDVNGSNPGFDPGLWSAVTDPSFNVDRAIAAAGGDKKKVAAIKSAAAMARPMMGGGSAARPSGAPSPSRPRYTKETIQHIISHPTWSADEKIRRLEEGGARVPPSLYKAAGKKPKPLPQGTVTIGPRR